MRPLADLGHTAYDTLEFVKEHYPEMVQMYETIMAHLKVPEAAPVVEPSEPVTAEDTHVAYTITDMFDTVIIDPDIIHNTLGYTDAEIPIMCKRAGLKYLGLYSLDAETFEEEDDSFNIETHSYEARQVPLFAIIKGQEPTTKYGIKATITKIPVNHKRTYVEFTAETYGCADNNFTGSDAVDRWEYTVRKGVLWNCAYSHQCVPPDSGNRGYISMGHVNEGTTYGPVAIYKCTIATLNQVNISVTTLIDVNDSIYLPEVL